MNIQFPGITSENLAYAVECIAVCRQEDAKDFGFNYPYFTPGGAYGKQWWQLDSSLALCGYKWIDRQFAETSLRNFIESQKADGRICLWGADVLPKRVAGGNFPEQNEGVSSLPKLFDVAYHLLEGSTDEALKRDTYGMLKKYLDWWFTARLDEKTGLITAVFEETFIPYLGHAGEYAGVDTNTEVYVACHYTALFAKSLGEEEEAADMEKRKEKLGESINRYMWNEEKGAYYPFDVQGMKQVDCLMASAFCPLRLCIAPKERRERLLSLLTDHSHFNWDTIPLTSVSKKDKTFTTTEGKYMGNASWSGNVWTLINEEVIRGLLDCGERELAAELAVKTLAAFKNNCTEFVNPFDGKGHGVVQYAWSASQFLELVIEVLFGVRYNGPKNEITVTPNLTPALQKETLVLSDLQIAKGIKADVRIENGCCTCKVTEGTAKVLC